MEKTTKVYFESGYEDTNVYLMEQLKPGHVIEGPAIVMDSLSTVLVEPSCTATITSKGKCLAPNFTSCLFKGIFIELHLFVFNCWVSRESLLLS